MIQAQGKELAGGYVVYILTRMYQKRPRAATLLGYDTGCIKCTWMYHVLFL